MYTSTFERVVAAERSAEQRAKDILPYIDESAFDYQYYDTFSLVREPIEEANDYAVDSSSLMRMLRSEAEPEDFVLAVVSAGLNPEDLQNSLWSIDRIWKLSDFNETAKFCLLRQAVMDTKELA